MERRDHRLYQLRKYMYLNAIGFCILLAFAYLFFFKTDVYFNECNYKTQKQKYEQLCSQYDLTNGKIKSIEQIDSAITAKRAEYFSNISLLEHKILNGESDAKIAYLTFDDGPYLLTEKYLDVLKENDVRATFFVRGFTDNHSVAMYRRELDEGHTIGNHTYTHNMKKIYSKPELCVNDVLALQYLLEQKVNYRTTIFRFPGAAPARNSSKNQSWRSFDNTDMGMWTGSRYPVTDGTDRLRPKKRTIMSSTVWEIKKL